MCQIIYDLSVWAKGNPLVCGFQPSWPLIWFRPLLLWTVSNRLWAAWHKCNLTELDNAQRVSWQSAWSLWCWACVPWAGIGTHACTVLTCVAEPTEKWFLLLLLCWVVLKHTRRLLRTPSDQANRLPLRWPMQYHIFGWTLPRSLSAPRSFVQALKSHFQINHTHINLCLSICFGKIQT